MPEYHQIETYTTINDDVNEVIDTCRRFLQELDWHNPDIENWLTNFVWTASDDGFVYANLSSPINIVTLGESMNVQLMFLGWTPKIMRTLPHPCLGFSILFETEKIEDLASHPEIRYKENVRKIVWNVMRSASQFFTEYGVFFTDEAQDGRTWRSLFHNDPTKLWQFECAIIPNNTKHYFKLPNEDFFSKETDDELWLARKSVWDEPVWL